MDKQFKIKDGTLYDVYNNKILFTLSNFKILAYRFYNIKNVDYIIIHYKINNSIRYVKPGYVNSFCTRDIINLTTMKIYSNFYIDYILGDLITEVGNNLFLFKSKSVYYADKSTKDDEFAEKYSYIQIHDNNNFFEIKSSFLRI